MTAEDIARRGVQGLMVPAVTMYPCSNFWRANRWASNSVGKVSLCLGCRCADALRILFGTSNETYQTFVRSIDTASFRLVFPVGSPHLSQPAPAKRFRHQDLERRPSRSLRKPSTMDSGSRSQRCAVQLCHRATSRRPGPPLEASAKGSRRTACDIRPKTVQARKSRSRSQSPSPLRSRRPPQEAPALPDLVGAHEFDGTAIGRKRS